MNIHQNIQVYGTKQSTGEYKLVFRSIELIDWLIKGEKTAKENNYSNFRYFSTGNLANHYTVQEIFIK